MRWDVVNEGKSIAWNVQQGELHTDDIEMAGFGCSDIVRYGVTENGFLLRHHPVFPSLRTRPNDTHASFQLDAEASLLPHLLADGERVEETLIRVRIDGTLRLECTADTLTIAHVCYPAEKARACFESVTVRNDGTGAVKLGVSTTGGELGWKMGPMGINIAEVMTDFMDCVLQPGETYTYSVMIYARLANEAPPFLSSDGEYRARQRSVLRLTAPMTLDTGNEILDTMFRFAKLRAGESVFETRYGLLHSPGGFNFYAATWCNDQIEYAGPFFAYTGDEALLEASMNAYRMYMPFMSDHYAPIPSSVIAEGLDYWNGAGDRGDAAMYLYGASRFALALGHRDRARELLPAIEWCAEYCRRKIDENGVIASDSDELEGRFPAGNANLCTSSLAYGGYLFAAALEREIGCAALAEQYEALAADLRKNMDAYFGAEIHGLHTYRYYDGCEILRSWICMPLCVGIYDRAEDTVRALCSERLLTADGFLTEEGCPTIWDRSTLYGLRGMFSAGETEMGGALLLRYAANRLLGERVPYAVEAYPEGGRRHLSGESALFCKVITEGILGMTPTGLRSFLISPCLPCGLDHLYLTDIHAHGGVFGVYVERDGYRVVSRSGTLLAEGKTGTCTKVTL